MPGRPFYSRTPCPYDYPRDCNCPTCVGDRGGRRADEPRWEKTTSSFDRDTGLAQTDFFSGTVGERDHKKKVHVAIDEYGNVVYVRDESGEVLYDKKRGIGYLPSDLNWSRW